MSWFDRYVLGPIAPRMALRREFAQRGLRSYYEAAEPSRYHKPRTDRRSGNAQAERAAMPIRNQARHLDENYDVASGVLDILVTNTIGRGIQPEPQIMFTSGEPAIELNTALLRLWDQWIYACDVTGQFHRYEMQQLEARSWFRDGEIFEQHILGTVPGLQHGTVLPYSVEALEADYVPNDLNDPLQRIFQGVEVNAWGRPVAYHVYKTHPGDNMAFSLARKRVPASVMSHVAFRKRFHQLRGISVFASTINRFDNIKETDENEQVAARVAAAMAAVIKKGNPDSYEDDAQVGADGKPARREMYFEPGIIFDELRPGEDIETIDTKRPNNALIEFRDSQLRSAAAGTMVSFSSAAKNYNGTYSSQRQELVEQWSVYQMLGSRFCYRSCQPTWDRFVDAAVLSGAVTVRGDVDRTTLYDCTHTGPSMIWIDPKKEADSLVLQMQWALKSRTRIIRERGDNPDQVNREIVRDQQERERLGIEFIEAGKAESDDKSDEETGRTTPGRAGARRDRRILNRS